MRRGSTYTNLSGLLALAACAVPVRAVGPSVRFLRFDEVREIVAGFANSGAVTGDLPDRRSWDTWIRASDREIRTRIDRGIDDSISNLILYGTAFTALPRIEGAEMARAPDGRLTELARSRVRAFLSAVAKQQKDERLRFAGDFLARRGVPTPTLESALESNLQRFAAEQRAYRESLENAGKSGDPDQVLFTRSTLYRERGLSVDTSLLPNFAIEDTLRAMMRKGALSPGSIRRIAVAGPGLDFADKRDGYDYYPLQTIQPFALIEAVARLGLGDVDRVNVTAFDLNPLVLTHVRGLAQQARTYTIQLPRDAHGEWKPEALAYWQHFGDIIGSPVPALAVPPALKNDVAARAVAIRPACTARVEAADLDVVAQTMDREEGNGYDLVVATNILVYYDLFQQALAKAAIGHMMNPGGVLLVNHALPSQQAGGLEFLGRRSVSYSSTGAHGDDVVAYRRRVLK